MASKRKVDDISDALDWVDLEDGWMKKLLDIDNESHSSYASFATKDVSRTNASKPVESHSPVYKCIFTHPTVIVLL